MLRPLHFMGEITKVPTFVRLLDQLVVAFLPGLKGEKVQALKHAMSEHNLIEPVLNVVRMSGAPEATALEEKLRSELDRHVHEAVDREFSGYRTWLLNSGLVLVVAFLDSFLDELLREVLTADPRRLMTAVEDRKLELKQIIDAPSREAIIADEICRVAKRVAFMNFKDRLAFLEKRFGIPIKAILTWSDFTTEAQTDLSAWDMDRLALVHEWRHQVAHRGSATPLTSIAELSEIADVFARLVLALAIHTSRQFQLELDWNAVQQELKKWAVAPSGVQKGPAV